MNIIKFRNWFFALSLLIIIPGIFALSTWGLRLGIDFAGGTLWEIKFTDAKRDSKQISASDVQNLSNAQGAEVSSTVSTSDQSVLIRMKVSDETKINEIRDKLRQSYGQIEDTRLETVGPVISKELTRKAAIALSISILAIVTYVTWAFRKVAKPASGLSFGVCAIVALIHDVLVVAGSFAILGHFAALEVDSLFITALLTVLGFSVHDTIVVFDRIRENLKKFDDYPFDEVVNHSVVQTLARSLNTSLTVIFVLLALLLFGGQTIKTFILALLIGVISGTYSSIFNAAPLLVVWQKITIWKKHSK